jgi:hypothetical protein
MSARAWAAAALLAFAAARAEAGAIARCGDAFIFEEARVNVVVLPYDYIVPEHAASSKTGQGLSLLVQMNTLSSILKYEQVGAIDLVRMSPNDLSCEPERVWQSLMSQAKSRGNGVVMVGGRIFEDGPQIYEQTFVRFARGGVPEETWSLRARDRGFDGVLSSQTVTFPAQTMSETDLERIASLISQYAVLRDQPRDDAPGHPLGPDLAKCLGCVDLHRPLSYVILNQQGAWEHIRNAYGDEGWLKLDTGFGSGPLAAKMPEMSFIEGAVGFLQSRMVEGERRAKYAGTADEALAKYVTATAQQEPPAAAVTATEMRALMIGADRAVTLLGEALAIAPADTEAHNLLALAKLNRWTTTKKPESQSQIVQEFVAASVLDPTATRALANLKSFLELSDDSLTERMSSDDAKAQLALVNSILAKRAPTP